MLGDFQYCSSSSEDDTDCDSDCSTKSEESLEKLLAEKEKVEEKIKAHLDKLRTIHGTLKSLNEERNKLLLLRNNLISSSCFNEENLTNDEISTAIDGAKQNQTGSLNSHVAGSFSSHISNAQPLNLDVPPFSTNNDEEEFDSD